MTARQPVNDVGAIENARVENDGTNSTELEKRQDRKGATVFLPVLSFRHFQSRIFNATIMMLDSV